MRSQAVELTDVESLEQFPEQVIEQSTEQVATPSKRKEQEVRITAPRFDSATFTIRGTTPILMHAWDKKAKQQMKEKQEAGSRSRKGTSLREAKDFDAAYEGALYKSKDGSYGIPCGAIRAACIAACRLTGFSPTYCKISLFIQANCFDDKSGTPLTRITRGSPEPYESMVRVANGAPDIRVRPMFREWEAEITASWDADILSTRDVANLLMRAGQQIGLLEGRPASPKSTGQGFGLFELVQGQE